MPQSSGFKLISRVLCDKKAIARLQMAANGSISGFFRAIAQWIYARAAHLFVAAAFNWSLTPIFPTNFSQFFPIFPQYELASWRV